MTWGSPVILRALHMNYEGPIAMSYSLAWARHASGASAEERHVQELLPRTVRLLALSCMGDYWMMGYDGGKKQPARNGNVRGMSNQEIPTNIMWYLDIFGCVKKIGEHDDWNWGYQPTCSLEKNWFLRAGEREHLWETPVIVLIVLWGKRQACDVVGLPKVSQASVLVWWGGSSGSCWWLNY